MTPIFQARIRHPSEKLYKPGWAAEGPFMGVYDSRFNRNKELNMVQWRLLPFYGKWMDCYSLSLDKPYDIFWSGPKVTKRPPGTHVSRSLLHLSGHPVAGAGVFDLNDAALVAASSGFVSLPTAVFPPRKDAAPPTSWRRLLFIQVAIDCWFKKICRRNIKA